MTSTSKTKSLVRFGPLVGAIDEGTSSARFILFKAETSEIVCSYQKAIAQITPQEGWVEQDPQLIMQVVEECIEKTVEQLLQLGGQVQVSFNFITFSVISRNPIDLQTHPHNRI